MSIEATRQSVVAAVEAIKSSIPGTPVIEYDNRIIIDTQTQTLPFMMVKLIYADGRQANLAEKPIHRLEGHIQVSAAAKEGDGTALIGSMVDYVMGQLQGKQFGAVRTRYGRPTPIAPHLGWVYFTVLIPFWVDAQTS